MIRGGIEDLWEKFIMHQENEKEKKAEDSQKEAIAKEGAEKIRQFDLGKLRKRDAKGSQKDKEIKVDCHVQMQKTPGNWSSSPILSLSSNNGMDFVNQHVACLEECQTKGLEIKEKLDLKTKREEHKVKEASNHEAEIEIQCEQHNQQIQMNMKMMEFLGLLTKSINVIKKTKLNQL